MDWPTIHAYAEEAELWTTLAINFWVIVTGVLVAIRRPRTTEALIAAISYSSRWSLAIQFGVVVVLLVANVTTFLTTGHTLIEWLAIWIAGHPPAGHP
jgi:cytochrome c biogenesis factor